MSQPLLSASNILDAEDLSYRDIDVPEWGGMIRLNQLNAEETTAFTDEMDTIQGTKDGMYLMLIHCARDAEGNRIFTKEDLPRLRKKSIRVLNRLQRIALEINQMDEQGEVALKKA